tara:strand:- start:4242 stop:4661 length:420 start_codon:yes stop_codon:yes gene_type:complete
VPELQHFVNAFDSCIFNLVDTLKHPLQKALLPLADILGIEILDKDEISESDLPLIWEGEVIGGVRRHNLNGALTRLLSAVEIEMNLKVKDMDRIQKQQAVALLNEWGAFNLRKSVESVAEALEVSRFTVYNYLERSEND